jgi:hypothetical protein
MARKTPKRGLKTLGASSSFKDTKMLWVLILIIATVIGFGVFYIMNSVTKQDTYYVLNTNIPSRTQITPDYMYPVTTSKGSAPANALSITDVQSGNIYSKYPLNAGDVVATSNAGALDSINEGIPDNWVVTSFDPGDSDPVVENLQRGDYFDIMVTNMKKSDTQSGTATSDQNGVLSNIKVGQWLFRNVMVLDNPTATTTSNSSDSSNGATSKTQNSTTMFLLGMSPRNSTILAMAQQQYSLKLVISPRQNSYTNPTMLDNLYKQFDFNDVISKNQNGIIASNCVDSATGEEEEKDCTDNTFSPQQRDKFGVPYSYNKAAGDTKDENGNPQPLTKHEIEWCTQLFDGANGYYSNSKWDDEKEYCAKNSPKTPDFKALLKKEKKAVSDAANSATANSLGSPSSSSSSSSGSSSATGDSSN